MNDKREDSTMSAEQETQLTVSVDEEDVTFLRELAAEQGAEIDVATTEGFEPVTTVTVIVIGTAFAVATIGDLLERHRGGQVIDLRENAPRIAYRDKGLMYGLVVVRRADGEVVVDVKEPKGMFGQVVEDVTKMAGGLAGASLAAAADAVRGTVGDAATVEARST